MNIATISKQIRAFADQLDATSEVEKPDPYAELKAAHAAGKVIQILNTQNRYVDADPTWQSPPEAYRIKPTESAKPEPDFQLPPPPPGMRWHREDGWKPEDLPSGYRPLVAGEKVLAGDETPYSPLDTWQSVRASAGRIAGEKSTMLFRTTRPLTFEHAGKTWTWHRPGDPMPCDGEREVVTLLEDLDIGGTIRAGRFDWGQCDDGEQIIGWRYADEKKTVPLGPEDVPPGSVIRHKSWVKGEWMSVVGNGERTMICWINGNMVCNSYRGFMEEYHQINRSIPLTGKWNPDAWEPCSKEIPA